MQGHTKLPDYHDMSGYPKTTWWTHIASMGQEGVDLVKQLLRFDPAKRLSAKAVSKFLGTVLMSGFTTSIFPRPAAPDCAKTAAETSCRTCTEGYTESG